MPALGGASSAAKSASSPSVSGGRSLEATDRDRPGGRRKLVGKDRDGALAGSRRLRARPRSRPRLVLEARELGVAERERGVVLVEREGVVGFRGGARGGGAAGSARSSLKNSKLSSGGVLRDRGRAAAGAAGPPRPAARGRRSGERRRGSGPRRRAALLLALGEQPLHLLDQQLRLEGLGDVTGGAGAGGARLVEGFEGARQEQHGDMLEARVGLDRLADLVAALARHHDVRQDQVRTLLARARDRGIAVVDHHEAHVLVGEADSHDLLDRDAIVGQQQGLGHDPPGCVAQRPCRPTRDGCSSGGIIDRGSPEIEWFSPISCRLASAPRIKRGAPVSDACRWGGSRAPMPVTPAARGSR